MVGIVLLFIVIFVWHSCSIDDLKKKSAHNNIIINEELV